MDQPHRIVALFTTGAHVQNSNKALALMITRTPLHQPKGAKAEEKEKEAQVAEDSDPFVKAKEKVVCTQLMIGLRNTGTNLLGKTRLFELSHRPILEMHILENVRAGKVARKEEEKLEKEVKEFVTAAARQAIM